MKKMAERICLLTGNETNCNVSCYNCDCGGEVALDNFYVSIYDIQRVCDIVCGMDISLNSEETAEYIRNELEKMTVEKTDVQPVKRGRWIEKPPYKDETVEGLEFQIVCSECDEQNCSIEFDECYNAIGKTFYKTRFCPNCGADMRDGNDD